MEFSLALDDFFARGYLENPRSFSADEILLT